MAENSLNKDAEESAEYAALFCTHKRGAGLAFFRVDANPVDVCAQQAKNRLAAFASTTPQQVNLPHTLAPALFFKEVDDSSLFATCAGLTAENLAELYKMALQGLGLNDTQVQCVGVVTGPGSFTGLRLGCAYVNGLVLGRSRRVWSVEGVPPEKVLDVCRSMAPSMSEDFCGQMSPELDDPFAVPTAFGDILVHLE
ncbi:hypothetical protein EBR21_06400, partial [bacterium]|nr:hypothetical protein [bacterium]